MRKKDKKDIKFNSVLTSNGDKLTKFSDADSDVVQWTWLEMKV